MSFIIQLLFILLGPWLILVALRQVKFAQWLSPVVLAYLLGILIVTFDLLPLNDELSKTATEVSILLAIPLLLFSTNIKQWFRQARHTAISFGLCILAGLIGSAVMAFVFKSSIENIWQPASMLVGVYTGGTPNMQAIGLALNAPEESFVLLNAADLLWSGIYLIFLTTIGKNVLGKFLPAYDKQNISELQFQKNNIDWKHIGIAIGLAILIMGLSLGITFLIFQAMAPVAFIILLLTTGSIAASFFPKIRNLHGSFEAGEYLLLIFCVAIGMRSDFGQLLQEGGITILFTGAVMISCILIHYLFSWMFKIDRDTTMITSTAAIFGPAFVGQIASVLKNREIVIAGMATGLIGYAVGNYLGLGLSLLLK